MHKKTRNEKFSLLKLGKIRKIYSHTKVHTLYAYTGVHYSKLNDAHKAGKIQVFNAWMVLQPSHLLLEMLWFEITPNVQVYARND